MGVLSYSEILKNIECKVSGVYFIYGEESYFVNLIIDVIRDKFSSNISVFFANDCNLISVLRDSHQLSFFSDFSVILIKDLQDSKFFNDKENIETVKAYIDNFNMDSIVCFFFNGAVTKNSVLLDVFRNAYIFNSKRLTVPQMNKFISDYCLEKNIVLDNFDSNIFSSYYNNNLDLIIRDIETGSICKPKYLKEFNGFEFLSYVSSGNIDKMILTVNNFGKKNKDELIPLFGLLFNFFFNLLIYHKSNVTMSGVYVGASRIYKEDDIYVVLDAIEYCDLCFKGIKSGIFNYIDIFRYLVGVLINVIEK